MGDYPAYLDAPDNEDSGNVCDCGEPAYDDAPALWQGLCYECYAEDHQAYVDELRAEAKADRLEEDGGWYYDD